MADTGQLNVEKKDYTKPTVTEVRLMAEEAVLATCKDGPSLQSPCGGDLTCVDTQRS